MNTKTTYSVTTGNSSIELQLPETTSDVSCAGPPTTQTIRDLVLDAIQHPIAYPELALAILDDDLVSIAVEDGVPRATEIVRELVEWLLSRQLKAEQITVVLSSSADTSYRAMLQAMEVYEGLRVVQHAAHDNERLEYIAAAETADAIYIQRDLVEASVVLPIYCIRHPEALNASDLYAMSPGFADAKTQQRWNLAWLDDNDHHMHLQAKLSREAGWLMGVQFALAVVPAQDGGVAGIVAGDPEQVFKTATTQLQESSYSETGPTRHDLVIASIDGTSDQQSWMNVARAVAKADMLLSAAGRLVVMCDVSKITDGIAQLASDEPDEQLERALLGGDLEDAFPAAVIRSVQAKRSVYLMAPLSPQDVESLGMAPISSANDIERLAQRTHSVCLLRTSQF
ncbi:MAG: lactate racemase domain-containing protein [Pirellula sp.]|jgi:nickel-dependent lactate racemase|nr:lactate racemase domain-containing protein [Pirellula sp.]